MKPSRLVPSLFLAALSVSARPASARPPEVDAIPEYAALRSARPTGSPIAVRDFTLERDAFRFHFASGSFELLPAVAGRVVGAVFVGDGAVELRPATEAERRHLAFLAGDKRLEVLSDRFETAVFLFTDRTAEEIAAHAAGTGDAAAARGALEAYEKFFKKQRKGLKNNLQIRLLEDILEGSDPAIGTFLAYFDGKKLPPAFAVVDPAGLASQFSGEVGGEGVALYVLDDEKGGYWYLCHTLGEIHSGRLAGIRLRARAEHYELDTTILKNARVRGAAILTFQPIRDGLRVLPVSLLAKLRVQEAALASADGNTWTKLPFVQENQDEDADVAVVFPQSLPGGQPARLKLTYEGKDVLQDAGDGNFLVGARESWYPNLGTFQDLATFDLTYRCPKSYQIVSVGEKTAERAEGDTTITVWKAERPIRVAGFNYGKFKRRERSDSESGVTVAVYTNPGEPDFIRELNFLLENRTDAGLHHVAANAENLADSAIADGINTARVGTLYFGKLPGGPISITQQTQAFFGQSWPSLIYLPYIAAFDGTVRHELGLTDAAEFVDLVGPHEFAHQWWGHRVGWESYRDQWLSEGFAEFTAALVLQFTAGLQRSNAFWEKARRWIEMKPRYASIANDEAGPITDGWRLSTWRNRSAAQAMIYSKGAYVLHMLRMLMRNPADSPPDGRFIEMLKDFVAAETDRNPSTRDFQNAVERHMTTAMDAAGDGKMDWFFREWVYGTEIPRFRQKLDITSVGGGRYRITGSITQDGVSAEFRSVAALYAESKGEVIRVALFPIVGSATVPVDVTVGLPKPPDRALVNALHDVLSRD